ncbi:MAG TPA: DEAD/DEAH box helicase [Planctomycetaceae bacterium]|nr:DEAD/DEAH box helicase [Planctomycetaceae bacterium]
MSFQELGLSEPILRAVADQGYTTPTPIQAQAIPHVAEGRDLLGCAQTGTGKTAAFALPILHRLTHTGNPPKGRGRRIRVLVLSPTRELALQIGESFATYGAGTALRQAVIFGGVNQNPQTRALQNGVDILIATPGRLLDPMSQGFIDFKHLEIFVLDEADRMLDMGFMPDIRRIVEKLPEHRQNLLFSATMPDDIRKLADTILRDPAEITIAPVKETTELIEQSVFYVNKQQKSQLLIHLLHTRPVERCVVFSRTKHGADRVVRHLVRAGIKAEALHGDKSQLVRQRTLGNFKHNRTQVLVATDLAARGIDVDGITHVVNFDLPHDPETYIHRIGRTGRAGANGTAIAFCDREERKQLKAIERLIRQTLLVEDDHPDYKAVPQHAEPAEQSERPERPARPERREHGARPQNGQSNRRHRGRTRGKPAPADQPAAAAAGAPEAAANSGANTAGTGERPPRRPDDKYRPKRKKRSAYAAGRR